MKIALINPDTGSPLRTAGDALVDSQGKRFPIIAGIPRICDVSNYSTSFGKQWNLFAATQIDRPGWTRAMCAW